MKVAGFVCAVLMIAIHPATAGERLILKVSPNIAFAPANLIVRTTVEANPDNRAIEIVAESTDFYRSSEVQLDGDRAPRSARFEFRSLPPGTYTVRATLKGAGDAPLALARQQVDVVEANGSY